VRARGVLHRVLGFTIAGGFQHGMSAANEFQMERATAFSLCADFAGKLHGRYAAFRRADPQLDHCDASKFDHCCRYDGTVYGDWEL
jgi:hypothetical protein